MVKRPPVELAVGWVLRGGVWIACACVLIGAVMYFSQHGAEVIVPRHEFTGQPRFLTDPLLILSSALGGDPVAMMQLGVLALIATPVVRVLASLVFFLVERDWFYCVVTLIVFSMLIWGLF